ncbi:DUF6624 domain-containing protein [Pedobacter caeni]|uniref:Tetratricopeptide repeat-containing protein n=1 Tax=Pedobacter caeni TaxID=288992 RepID=A0A1M4WWY8_9SPHI|nr:DUF6624 domain-containing protein [Pedobacter caeni]SHE85708.1 hypothetical protein SAMN04488522_1011415 [Pedobacter caeni]
MKKRFAFIVLLVGCSLFLKAQPGLQYQELVARASLCHLQKDYKQAILYFERAFELEQPDELNAYKAAGVYALARQQEKAFHYLDISIKKGWTEADWLASDPYFENLRSKFRKDWDLVIKAAYEGERNYEGSLKHPQLRKKINLLTLNDQRLRYARIQATNKEEQRTIDEQIHQSDRDNLEEVKKILKEYGWPKLSDIGRDGQNNLWLMVQHADHDVSFQQYALGLMEQIKHSGQLTMENYAFLYDRVKCNLNYKQSYGTQVNWSGNGKAAGFRRIAGESEVDQRRKLLGLPPLYIYALTYGFDYKPLTKKLSAANDISDLKRTKKLLDSAWLMFREGQFSKAYDAGNTASTIAGGMNDEQNYQSAVLFAKIARTDEDPKYKSIALDFLGLLKQRNTLSNKRLLQQPEFKLLQEEPRWKDLFLANPYQN